MKKLILIVLFASSVNMFSQILDPVKWSTSVVKVSDSEYELVATATIEEGWHLYSQSVPEDGPIPTSFTYEGSKDYLKKGNTAEGKGHEIDDPIFEMRIKYFEKKADFKQRVKLKSKTPFTVNGVVEYMVCNDSQCLPPKEVELVFEVK